MHINWLITRYIQPDKKELYSYTEARTLAAQITQWELLKEPLRSTYYGVLLPFSL